MQLASVTFDGAKKNRPHFIIPATFFRKLKGSQSSNVPETSY